MNIREIANLSPNYFDINREERNYSAIMFAALCNQKNAEKFIKRCGFDEEIGPDFGIYFEYAYLRDLWKQIEDENIKKEIIRQHLQINQIETILGKSIIEINRAFGVKGNPSRYHIQYPGNWAISKFDQNFDDKDFEKICLFKWAFNIKPDIVIHLEKSYAICIEAKVESSESSYPSASIEKVIFAKRGIKYPLVRQCDLQKTMMSNLLGINTRCFVLAKRDNEKGGGPKIVTWKEAFADLDMSYFPSYVKNMITNGKI
jgi:hypothetical protein